MPTEAWDSILYVGSMPMQAWESSRRVDFMSMEAWIASGDRASESGKAVYDDIHAQEGMERARSRPERVRTMPVGTYPAV
jgi:hypothetical protein